MPWSCPRSDGRFQMKTVSGSSAKRSNRAMQLLFRLAWPCFALSRMQPS